MAMWSLYEGVWSVEASTLYALNRTLFCPACDRVVDQRIMHPHHDDEGEVTHWSLTCSCHAKMYVWND